NAVALHVALSWVEHSFVQWDSSWPIKAHSRPLRRRMLLSSARLAHLPPLRFHPRGSDFDTQSSITLQLPNRRDERRLRPDTSPVFCSLAGYDCATPWCNQSVCPPAYQTLFSCSRLRASLGPVEPYANRARPVRT